MLRRLRIPLDVLLLGALLALGLGEALGDRTLTGTGHAVSAAVAVAVVVALAFRRRAPEATFVAVGVLVSVCVAVSYGWTQGPFFGFLEVAVALFTLGLHGRGRRPLVLFGALALVGIPRDVYPWRAGWSTSAMHSPPGSSSRPPSPQAAPCSAVPCWRTC